MPDDPPTADWSDVPDPAELLAAVVDLLNSVDPFFSALEGVEGPGAVGDLTEVYDRLARATGHPERWLS
jgi:hypothetical protein